MEFCATPKFPAVVLFGLCAGLFYFLSHKFQFHILFLRDWSVLCTLQLQQCFTCSLWNVWSGCNARLPKSTLFKSNKQNTSFSQQMQSNCLLGPLCRGGGVRRMISSPRFNKISCTCHTPYFMLLCTVPSHRITQPTFQQRSHNPPLLTCCQQDRICLSS